jgi:uracil-DNA glycosylase
MNEQRNLYRTAQQATDTGLQEVDELVGDINRNGKVEFQNHQSDLLNTEDRDDQWLIRPNNDGSDDPWEVCEFASREFWLPVLGAELAGVEPNVIVPIGEKATLAIFQLYGIDKDWNRLYEAALDEYRDSERGPAVVPSYHWSWANMNISNNKESLYGKS